MSPSLNIISYFETIHFHKKKNLKITNLGKSCQFDTTSYAEVVPIKHDFCHVILKSCQVGTTSALLY